MKLEAVIGFPKMFHVKHFLFVGEWIIILENHFMQKYSG